MIRYLVYAGLAVTPYLTIKGYDSRYPKELFALGIALFIALLGFYRDSRSNGMNKWPLLFIAWAFVATTQAPHIKGLHLSYGGNMDGLWNYHGLFMLMVYLSAWHALLNVCIKERVIDRFFKIMAYSGALMAIYMMLQGFLGIDPMFHVPHIKNSVTETKSVLLYSYESEKNMLNMQGASVEHRQQALQRMFSRVYEELAKIPSFNGGAEVKGQLSQLCRRLLETGNIEEDAVSRLRKSAFSDASPRLYEAAFSALVMPTVPSFASQESSIPQEITATPGYKFIGTLGHPTIVAAYILMCLPAAFYLRKRLLSVVMILAIFVTQSDMAIFAFFMTMIFNLLCWNKKILFLVFAMVALAVWAALENSMIHDSGRFAMWAQAYGDMKANPATFLWGFGLGSFAYIFPIAHDAPGAAWFQMHNEYLEVGRGIGLVGMCLMVRCVLQPFIESMAFVRFPQIRALLMSYFSICVCSAGTFLWHLGVFQIYTIIIVGLLMQQVRKKENLCTL